MSALVSVCVPVYGVEHYIEKCCRSLFEQTYPNIEYIFVDDCTPDASIEVVKRVLQDYPFREEMVRIIHHKKNKGLSGARNTALEAVTGEYLMYVDSDDYIDLNTVGALVEKAQEEKADVVFYDMRYVYPRKQYVVHQQLPTTKEKCIRRALTFKVSVCVCGGLYAASLFQATDVKFIEGLNFGEDYVVKPRILYYAHKIVHCKDCYYNYVQYNASSYTLSYKSKNIDDLTRAISILNAFFSEKIDYAIYRKSLDEAHLMVKSRLLIAICLHRKSVWNRLPMVAELYKDITDVYSHIPLSYRIILWLADHKMYSMLYTYVNLGFRLKQILK